MTTTTLQISGGRVVKSSGKIIAVVSGGGALTSLGTLVSGMPAGTWATWSGGAMSNTLTNPGGGGTDPAISNGTTCNWDPVRNWIQYYGHGHAGGQSIQFDYQDSNNVWINTNPPPFATNAGEFLHQFLGQTMDSVTGDEYWFDTNHFGGHVWRRVATTWTDLGLTPQGNHAQLDGAAFNPNYGTSGGAFFGSWYGIDVWDVSAGSYTQIYNGSGGITIGDQSGAQQCFGFYDVTAQSVYFATVAGSAVGSKALVKVTKTGSFSQKSAIPATVAINIATALSSGQIVDGYTSTSTISGQNTSGTVRKPLLITPSGAMYKYDSTGDTWTVVTGVTNPDATDANNGMIMGVCPQYDCVFMFAQTGTLGDMTAHVYKRSVND